jgi:hypothetical protein
MILRSVGLGLTACWFLGLGLDGCTSKSNASDAIIDNASASCFVNSDCASPLVCAFQRCHAECITTRDCHGTERCVGAQEVFHVCQLDAEAHCNTSADCVAGFACGPDGACRDRCASAADCVSGQVCVAGVCAETSELDADGALPKLVTDSSCRLNSDCAPGSKCASGTCVSECRADSDCESGKVCDGGACGYPGAARCATSADCPTTGAECVSGQCHCACLADVDCAAGQTCDGCACHVAPPECSAQKPCNAGKICTFGNCACECKTDRDCAATSLCDGCSCQLRAAPSTVSSAQILTPLDIDGLAGVTDVQGELRLGGELITTTGLDEIQSVGSLLIDGTDLIDTAGGAPALTGLSGLVLIRGDLTVAETRLSALSFNPALVVEGNVTITANPALSTCAILDFQARLAAHGFTGSFSHTGAELVCERHCQGPLCVPS